MKKILVAVALASLLVVSGCGTDKNINRAKMSAAKYWTDKAYPGKAFDVQVLDATKVDDGKYRVKAMVDGQQRVGLFNPDTETFDEGYYSLASERGKKIAEIEEENRYLKDQLDKKEKELYQLKLRLKYVHAGRGDPNSTVDSDTTKDDGDDEPKPVKKAKATTEEKKE
ncbi:MAG: hypothetical protein HY075_14535 [Deltaproteobacteria bacterium]|nr:hypothetical protein [Deltaproteobacteria bacterium]